MEPKERENIKKKTIFFSKTFKIEGLTLKNNQYSGTLNAYKEALHKLLFNYNSRFEYWLFLGAKPSIFQKNK